VGRGASGVRDGRVALYLREQVRELLRIADGFLPPTPLHQAIIDCLRTNGASFLIEIESRIRASGVASSGKDLDAALWDLVWTGQITNDTFGPLRDLGRTGPRRGRRQAAGGRWALVQALAPALPESTSRAVAIARLLLDRYGIVSRTCARFEEIDGGFAPLYKVYREMEEQGQVRRGHFVEGLEGAQFAYAGAVDRLRGVRPDAEERDREVVIEDIRFLAAMDPANPYGALIPWPEPADAGRAKPRRTPGAWVLLARGRPVLYLGARGRALITFPETIRTEEGALAAAIAMLRNLPRGTSRGTRVIEKIDGMAAEDSPLRQAFTEAGYVSDYRGLIDAAPPGEHRPAHAAG
jgi:ATP-dependent Lhr-like helicase